MSSDNIYSAKYSGVDVYEFIHPTGSIMKRKADNWVNATHILKAAKFPKAKRTRILEKEVITDTHEKVQGGFGKYQGTWIPIDLARKLAEKFEVLDELRPLFDFTQKEGSEAPPPAPKHHHASRSDSVRKKATKSASTTTNRVPEVSGSQAPVAPKRRGRPPRNKQTVALQRSQSDMVFPKPSIPSSNIHSTKLPSLQPHLGRSSTTLSPIMDVKSPLDQIPPQFKELDIEDGLSSDVEQHPMLEATAADSTQLMATKDEPVSSSSSLPSSPHEFSQSIAFGSRSNIATPIQLNGTTSMNMILPKFTPSQNSQSDASQRAHDYLSKLVHYFVSSETQNTSEIPVDLLNPPLNSSPFIDTWIDPEHHTAFHWACAMGNIPIVEALLRAGSSIRAANNVGETPLIRSSMFHNCYTRRTYAQILEVLKDTIFDVDAKGRNVIHRIVERKSSTPSAVYYLDVLLSKIKDFTPRHRIDILVNQQDTEGNSPLHYAAINKDEQFYQLLVKNGALTAERNNNGMTANDLLLGSEPNGGTSQKNDNSNLFDFNRMFPSQAATRANRVIPEVINMFKDLSKTYFNIYKKQQNDSTQLEKTIKSMRKTITSVNLKTMEIMELRKLEHVDSTLEEKKEVISGIMNQIIEGKRKLTNELEKGQVKLLRKLVEEEIHSEDVSEKAEKELDEIDNENVQFLIKELVLMQMRRKRKLDEIVDLITDNSKVYKYRKMISQGTDIEAADVDECLDVIYETLSKEL